MPPLPSRRDSESLDPTARAIWSLMLSGGGLVSFGSACVVAMLVSVDNPFGTGLMLCGVWLGFASPAGVVIAQGKLRWVAGTLSAISLSLVCYVLFGLT